MIERDFNDNFWKKGNGKAFLRWSNVTLTEERFSAKLFYEFDEKVDLLVEHWTRTGQFGRIMKSLHTGSFDKLPQDFIEFKNDATTTPEWLNSELLQYGCELCERSGLMGLLILRNFALLGGYNFANLTKPLVATGALEKDAVLRLHHTLDFWVSVSRTGLDAASKRINACLKTRLVHSASRLYIQKKMPDWETEKFGIPINHADSIATNIAFTVYFLYGLQKLNFKCTTKESQGIFHLWKYNAYLLGLPAAIVPENQAEALQFFYFWTRYQNVPDDDALKLAHALLNENTPVNVLKFDFIKKNMGYVHKSVANFLIDKEFRRRLEIPSVPFGGFIPFVVKLKNQLHKTRRHQIKFGNEEQLSVLRDYKTRAQQQKNHPKL